MDPWDCEESDIMMEGPPVEEEQLGPPEEEQLGPAEAEVQVEEPAASIDEPTASVQEPTTPVVAAILPVQESPCATPKRRRGVEPTAKTPTPLLAGVLPSPPKLRRLLQKTSVPQHVCPRRPAPSCDWEKQVKDITEDFVSPHFFRKLD